MFKFLYRILCGFFLGLSIFAPGISGSVIAIIMGVYHDILEIISNPFKRLKHNILYCLPLVIGAGISAVVFVLLFSFLFETYEKAAYLLFVGLIAGNMPVIFSEIKQHKFKAVYLIGGAVAFVVVFVLGIMALGGGSGSGAAESSGLFMFAIGGLIAGFIALIPGMSISTTLIIIGIYSQLIFAAETLLRLNFDLAVHFGLFGICFVGGLVLAAGRIKALFEKIPGFANVAVFGFMAGSLASIFVHALRMPDINFNWIFGGLVLAAGLGISMLFVVISKILDGRE